VIVKRRLQQRKTTKQRKTRKQRKTTRQRKATKQRKTSVELWNKAVFYEELGHFNDFKLEISYIVLRLLLL
jgi:hypothetical protein